MLDSHTHSNYSMDSETPSEDMVKRAIELGLDYYAITDHFNADYINIAKLYRANSRELKYPLDLEGHIEDVLRLQDKYRDKLYVAVGVECGYSRESEAIYLDSLDRDRLDVIVNSIHTVDNGDIYDLQLYDGVNRDYIFKRYLECVRASIDAPYPYDIIGHIGYMSRKAPYPNNLFTMDEFGEEIDDILRAIIARNKCLECNAKSKNTPYEFLPGREILTRYYELGGRKISYGSDAHNTDRLAEKFDLIASIAKSIGFAGFTYFVGGKPYLAKF